MAYTFDYRVVEAVTAFLNGDDLTDEERTHLTDLASSVTAAATAGWPPPGGEDEEDDDEYPVPMALDQAFTAAGFTFDEAESDDACAGYSRYLQVEDRRPVTPPRPGEEPDLHRGGTEVYCFGVVDDTGVQVYATHRAFRRLAAGDYAGAVADGVSHLTVATERHPTDVSGEALAALLATLDAAVAAFFRGPDAPEDGAALASAP